MCIHVHACCGTCLTCLHCKLWYSLQVMHYDDTTTISVLFLAPTSSCYNFWLGCCSILMDSIFCWDYLFKKKIEIVIWCSMKTIYMFFQNVCSFAIKCVCPSFCSPKVCSPLIPLPKILVRLILIQD